MVRALTKEDTITYHTIRLIEGCKRGQSIWVIKINNGFILQNNDEFFYFFDTILQYCHF